MSEEGPGGTEQPGPTRSQHMAARVLRTAQEMGVAEVGLGALERAHSLAMAPRLENLDDDHDPHFLHPGRTALILLMDVGEARTDVLTAALLVESERPELKVPLARVREALGEAVAERVAAVPLPDDEELAERLVTADEEVRLIALAERLDHLRHAHLWSDLERRRSAHRSALEVYAPVAERTHPALARRYAWWCDMFARRHLR